MTTEMCLLKNILIIQIANFSFKVAYLTIYESVFPKTEVKIYIK